jgi:hypothetical protein
LLALSNDLVNMLRDAFTMGRVENTFVCPQEIGQAFADRWLVKVVRAFFLDSMTTRQRDSP